MKNLISSTTACVGTLFILITFLSRCTPESGKATQRAAAGGGSCSMTFAAEDSIILIPHELDTTIAESEILEFTSVVSTSTSPQLPLLVDSISGEALCSLKDTADHIHALDSSCTDYITGVKISFGLDENLSDIILLFQPVVLCRTGKFSNRGAYQLSGISSDYYIYDNASETFTVTTDTTSISRYKNEILIVHTATESPLHFRTPPTGNDTLGDVGSLVYTFQEISAIMQDNNSTYIKLWNAVQDLQIPSVSYSLRKLTIVLGPQQLSVPLTSFDSPCNDGGFCNKFANLSHLCPPSCNDFTFELW